jgi:hypothetical protein
MAERQNTIPVAEYALTASISREKAIRLIQTGEVKGGILRGRWVVYAAQPTEPVAA